MGMGGGESEVSEAFRQRLVDEPEAVMFEDTMGAIAKGFDYTPKRCVITVVVSRCNVVHRVRLGWFSFSYLLLSDGCVLKGPSPKMRVRSKLPQSYTPAPSAMCHVMSCHGHVMIMKGPAKRYDACDHMIDITFEISIFVKNTSEQGFYSAFAAVGVAP